MSKIEIIKCQCDGVDTLVSVIDCSGQKVLIDSGTETCTSESVIPWFKKNKVDLNNIHMIVNTHTHGDHIGGNSVLKNLNKKILIAVHREGVSKMKEPYKAGLKIREKYSHILPLKFPNKLEGMDVDIVLNDNDTLDINGTRLKIFYTPGHDTDCICIYDEETKTLFTGDSVQGGGTTDTGIAFYQDLNSYKSSLQKLINIDISRLILGHSFYPSDGVINGKDKVKEFLRFCLNRVKDYNDEIESIISTGENNLLSITQKLIDKKGFYKHPASIFLAMYSVDAYLKK